MAWSDADIQTNREYFTRKLNAIKERNAVVKAIEQGAFDFILLDTRPRDAFKFGHITGAWSAPLADLGAMMSRIPKDKEVVTYCWSHD
jgi:rhodanese-related sulfurtransferase